MIQRISIHALLAESDQTVTKWASSAKISIHALLAESDKSSWSLTRLNRNISIHALLAESDGLGFCYHCDDVAFLSTLSLRRATAPNRRPCRCNKISIHALLAESDLFFIVFDLFRNISIHALLAESDSPLSINCMIHMQFLSTLSLRRATMQIVIIVVDTVISIHALLAESDQTNRSATIPYFNFYPRSPCGERHIVGGAGNNAIRISIHALLAESDLNQIQPRRFHYRFLSTLSLRRATQSSAKSTPEETYFYPRSPCGERRAPPYNLMIHHTFLSTLSLRRATPKRPKHQTQTQNFYPRSPCGERQNQSEHCERLMSFLSTLSLRRATWVAFSAMLPNSVFLSTLSLRRATNPAGPLV